MSIDVILFRAHPDYGLGRIVTVNMTGFDIDEEAEVVEMHASDPLYNIPDNKIILAEMDGENFVTRATYDANEPVYDIDYNVLTDLVRQLKQSYTGQTEVSTLFYGFAGIDPDTLFS